MYIYTYIYIHMYIHVYTYVYVYIYIYPWFMVVSGKNQVCKRSRRSLRMGFSSICLGPQQSQQGEWSVARDAWSMPLPLKVPSQVGMSCVLGKKDMFHEVHLPLVQTCAVNSIFPCQCKLVHSTHIYPLAMTNTAIENCHS